MYYDNHNKKYNHIQYGKMCYDLKRVLHKVIQHIETLSFINCTVKYERISYTVVNKSKKYNKCTTTSMLYHTTLHHAKLQHLNQTSLDCTMIC